MSKQQELVDREKIQSAQLAAKQQELENKILFTFLPSECCVETNNGKNTWGQNYRRLSNDGLWECANVCSKHGEFYRRTWKWMRVHEDNSWHYACSGGRVLDEMSWRFKSDVRVADEGDGVL